jgi:DNA-binding transcriptional LysR family regulator
VSWRRLADVPLVLYARDAAPVLFDAVLGTFQAHGIPVRPRHHAADLATALTLVAAGLGVTILPSGWQPPHALGVACRPLRPPLVTIALGVAHRRGGRSPSVARFIEAARAGGAGPRPRATTEAAPRAREPA